MSNLYRQTFGRIGETLAKSWLEEAGFTVLQQNWRTGRFEIDLIAYKDMILHFIEVKTRKDHSYGYPEQAVTKKKLQHIMQAAAVYQKKNPQWKRVQYDILAITLAKEAPASYYFLEDVYF